MEPAQFRLASGVLGLLVLASVQAPEPARTPPPLLAQKGQAQPVLDPKQEELRWQRKFEILERALREAKRALSIEEYMLSQLEKMDPRARSPTFGEQRRGTLARRDEALAWIRALERARGELPISKTKAPAQEARAPRPKASTQLRAGASGSP